MTVAVSLRLLEAGPGPPIQGELLACTYMPDGAFVLSGGWDGHLRLWEANQGGHVTAIRTGDKPVAACAASPDGKQLISGGLDGLLAYWDALTHQRGLVFLAHPRPISAIGFQPDGRGVVTAAWDGTLMHWKSIRERDGKALTGHKDIIAGCRLTPDGTGVVSWSHDATVRYWDLNRNALRGEYRGHDDRVLAGAVSPDGRYAASGARDGGLKLWDLEGGRPAGSSSVVGELRSLHFLLDGATLLAIDARGCHSWHALPSLEKIDELLCRLPVQDAALSPCGTRVALACGDGKMRLVAIDGLDECPLVVMAQQVAKKKSAGLTRLIGMRSRLVYQHQITCPACRHTFGLTVVEVGQEKRCAGCGRGLRIGGIARADGVA